jgi:4-amino-4-deoxy-L-arabinose transferase-like glycosyltransferase
MSVKSIYTSISSNKKIMTGWLLFLFILAIIPYIFTIIYSPVSIDGSYYLSMVERIRDGLTPYRDFTLEYTPVFFYLTAFFKNLFSVGINYTFDLSFHFVIQLIVTYLIWVISQEFSISKILSFYAAIFYLLVSFWIAQYEFILEIPSLLWGLLGFYLALKYKERIIHFLLIGVITSLSFLTKQYGFGFFVLIIFLIFFNSKKWNQLLFFFIGYFSLILLFLVWLPQIKTVFGGNGYGTNEVDKSFIDFIWAVIKRMANATGYFLIRIPIVVFTFLLLPKIIRKNKKNTLFLLIGIFGFMLQFVFALFNHYALYIIPFITILIFFVLKEIRERKLLFQFYSILLIMTISMAIFKNYSRIITINRELRNEQIALAEKIKKQIEPNSTLYIADTRLVDLYYLLNLRPVNMRYTFGLTMTEKLHFKQLQDADYILTYEKPDTLNFNYLNSERVNKFIENVPDKKLIEDQFQFDRKSNKVGKNKIYLYRNIRK